MKKKESIKTRAETAVCGHWNEGKKKPII